MVASKLVVRADAFFEGMPGMKVGAALHYVASTAVAAIDAMALMSTGLVFFRAIGSYPSRVTATPAPKRMRRRGGRRS